MRGERSLRVGKRGGAFTNILLLHISVSMTLSSRLRITTVTRSRLKTVAHYVCLNIRFSPALVSRVGLRPERHRRTLFKMYKTYTEITIYVEYDTVFTLTLRFL